MSRVAEWSPYTTYIVGDVVNYIGIRYTATAINVNTPPLPSTPIWVGVPSSTGVNVNLSNSNITAFPTFVSATTGNLPVLVDSGFTYNPALGDITINETLKLQNTASGNRVGVGYLAGSVSQSTAGVAVGALAGETSQGLNAVAVGAVAGSSSQGNYSVAVGNVAGSTNQGQNAVAVGVSSGQTSQSVGAVAVGQLAGQTSQGTNSIAIGVEAGQTTQGARCVAVGRRAGLTTQGTNATAVGHQAGQTAQGGNAVAVGHQAGQTSQRINAVAVGLLSGNDNQGLSAVAVGLLSGQTSQGENAVAVGNSAGNANQGVNAVAFGNLAGETSQGLSAVAVGVVAGQTNQGLNAVAVGNSAGNGSQGSSATAIGYFAGAVSQGAGAVAVGSFAGVANQHANSIILNGTGSGLNSNGTDRFFVKPIRNVGLANALSYDASTGEIGYSSSGTVGSTSMISGIGTNTSSGSTRFGSFPVGGVNGLSLTGTESEAQISIPFNCSISNFYVAFSANVGTVGNGYTTTIRKNGVNSLVAVALTGAVSSGSDLVDSISFTAGDLFSISVVPTGTPSTNLNLKWTARMTSA
jgi:hypothetical protein